LLVVGRWAIYAIRRGLYSPLLPTDINDFLNPLQIVTRVIPECLNPQPFATRKLPRISVRNIAARFVSSAEA